MTKEQEQALREVLIPLIISDLMPLIKRVIEKRLNLILDECVKASKAS